MYGICKPYVLLILLQMCSETFKYCVQFSVAYAQIDWHDFVVVETVDYQPYEHGNFPPPTTPDEVGARVLMQVSEMFIDYLNYFI